MWKPTSAVLLLAGAACDDATCGRGDPCPLPSPCPEIVAPTCPDPTTTLKLVLPGDPLLPEGPAGTGAGGDVVLRNSALTVVLAAVGHPDGRSPSGGTIVDLAANEAGPDGLAQIAQVSGPDPGEGVAYGSHTLVEDPGGVLAVEFRGSASAFPELEIATRYEIRPCEPFVRVRTEVANRGTALLPVDLADVWLLGGQGLVPEAPGVAIDPGWPAEVHEAPFAAFGLRADSASYATAACEGTIATSLHAELTGVGPGVRWVAPGGTLGWDRIVAVADGPSPASAAALLADALQTPSTVVTGRIALAQGDPGPVTRASIVASDDDEPPTTRITAVPAPDGAFTLSLPRDEETWRLSVRSFGDDVAGATVVADRANVDVGEIALPAAGALELVVALPEPDGWATVDVLPADPAEHRPCHPRLGPPGGGSPACNRVLVRGAVQVAVPPGRWEVVAGAGPAATVDRAIVEVEPGNSTTVALALARPAELVLPDALTVDPHVHGRGSADSAIPDADRVASLAAAGLDLVVATDRDRVSDWSSTAAAIAPGLITLSGVEATPELPFRVVDGRTDTVVGHWIAWPLVAIPDAPWGGAPPDEFALPGVWIDRLTAYGWAESLGVVQLPHPWATPALGLDRGWFSALDVALDAPFDPRISEAQGLVVATPEGAAHANDAWHVQEVLSGRDTASLPQLRAVWHALLDRGLLRGATGGSDSHTVLDVGPGAPRTIVFAPPTAAGSWSSIDVASALRDGRALVTNGPVIDLSTTDLDGAPVTPGLTPFVADNVAMLDIRVSAAPWIPVDEVRLVVNGAVVQVWTGLPEPDPSAGALGPLLRLEDSVPLHEVLVGPTDGWIVVEAGSPLRALPDLDRDGLPDAPTPELPPVDPGDPRWLWSVLAPGADVFACTNPLLVDHDGLGFAP